MGHLYHGYVKLPEGNQIQAKCISDQEIYLHPVHMNRYSKSSINGSSIIKIIHKVICVKSIWSIYSSRPCSGAGFLRRQQFQLGTESHLKNSLKKGQHGCERTWNTAWDDEKPRLMRSKNICNRMRIYHWEQLKLCWQPYYLFEPSDSGALVSLKTMSNNVQ